MAFNAGNDTSKKISSLAMILMMLLVSLSLVVPNATAVGPNQNDFGTTGGDLPDNMSSTTSIPNLIFTGSVSGTGELYPSNDEYDYLRVSLAANEGLAVELSFDSSDDFDLIIYDSSAQNIIDNSYSYNPETVTTNGSTHGGMVYIEIFGYLFSSISNWSYDITIWKFTTNSSTGGGGSGGSNGTAVPNPCAGSSVAPDILEPNNNQATATLASLLPIYCTGLSVEINSAGTQDEDYFEVQMISGVTYYFNLTFLHMNGDIDARLEDSTGTQLTFNNFGYMSSSSDNEAGEYTATTNFTAYFVVYHYSGLGGTSLANSYDVEISTDNPGGGQSFTTIEVTMNNMTSLTLAMNDLTVGDTYQYEYFNMVIYDNNNTFATDPVIGPYSFVATATTETVNYTIPGGITEGEYATIATLYDSTGAVLHSDTDSIYQEVVIAQSTSSTTGDIFASNLSVGNQYTVYWFVFNVDMYIDELNANPSLTFEDALNLTIIDEDTVNYTATMTYDSWQVSWVNPTTMDTHGFYATIFNQGATVNGTGDGALGNHFVDFIPQLPSAIITSYSFSTTSATNDFTSEGLDLVPNDLYYQQFRVEDASGADIEISAMNSVTASAQNMSFGTFYYNTPTVSGQYCLYTDLYDGNFVQIVGDYVCLQYVFDDDGDGVANELDLCAGTAPGSIVDTDGCATSQKDSDSDGYNDDVDDFPYDDTQWLDSDGDGYGDNPFGNSPDAFPYDSSQWDDTDMDEHGDNPNGNNSDAFPYDSSQWSDTDMDGYGDNASGNNPDLWPADSSQWTDSDGDGYGDNSSGTYGDAFPFDNTQWSDSDGDGYGDNVNGNNPDKFPNDGTQWEDTDSDGYGDNANGNNPDKFPNEPTQWFDGDGDGYGDNQQGLNPDAFPSDSTQWSDSDGDGYGDNANGNNPDRFPNDATQWQDSDLDGFGDNANGNNPDLCINTPFGETVDEFGCSSTQNDSDNDQVYDAYDACPMTPAGESVDSVGCSDTQKDGDNDGVNDQYDLCVNTPIGTTVDASGCSDYQLDNDGDGISNAIDSCPNTDPGLPVNGFGCAENERDTDEDSVLDSIDICPYTPATEIADNTGCSISQRDTDLDGVTDNNDACNNTLLKDENNDGTLDVDTTGCSPDQYDDDQDLIDNTVDLCKATPAGEQVDANGCSESQKDEDNDDVWNSDDLCYDTPANQAVDLVGCSEYQKDDDDDNYPNALDKCKNTPSGEIVNSDGCSLSQIDSDGDGVTDDKDDFKFDRNETTDSDNDGVPDRWDAYPLDETKSEAEKEESGSGFVYAAVAILILAVIGALLFVKNRDPPQGETSPFVNAGGNQGYADDSSFMMNQEQKNIPEIEQTQQTWEENGVHWSRAPDGTLSYYDNATQSWLLYQN